MNIYRKNRSLLRLCCCLCIILICFLTACTPKQAKISEAELVQLRKQYPYNDAISTVAQMTPWDIVYPTFDSLLGVYNQRVNHKFYAAVVLEMTGDWYSSSCYVAPYDDEALNKIVTEKTPSIGHFTWELHDAVIKQVLWGGEGLEEGDTIALGFGSTLYVGGMELDAIYLSGNRYVCFLAEESENALPVEDLYSTAKTHTWYLTQQDVLVSVTSKPGQDVVSGMYLSAFTDLIYETFAKEVPRPDFEAWQSGRK